MRETAASRSCVSGSYLPSIPRGSRAKRPNASSTDSPTARERIVSSSSVSNDSSRQ